MPRKMPTQRNNEKSARGAPQQASQSPNRMSRQTHPALLVQHARHNSRVLNAHDIYQLQHTLGNRQVGRLLAGTAQRQPVTQAGASNRAPLSASQAQPSRSVQGIQRMRIEPPNSTSFESTNYTQEELERMINEHAEDIEWIDTIQAINTAISMGEFAAPVEGEFTEPVEEEKITKKKRSKSIRNQETQEYLEKSQEESLEPTKKKKNLTFEDKEISGQLEWSEDNNRWQIASKWFTILNEEKVTENLEKSKKKKRIKYKRLSLPKKIGGDIRDQIFYDPLGGGVVITNFEGETVGMEITESKTEFVSNLLDNAEIQIAQKEKDKQEGKTRYTPQQINKEDMGYIVDWLVSEEKEKNVIGTTNNRQMYQSMDLLFAEGEDILGEIKGEQTHRELKPNVFSRSTHGNELPVMYRLVYRTGEGIAVTNGTFEKFGSGKTTSDVQEKHNKADEIATMLVDSGQIGNVGEYIDEKHAHSEQAMVVELSRKSNIFDEELRKIKSSKEAPVEIIALIMDINSSPNTVCDRCHNSIETFLGKTDWLEKVVSHLKEQKKKGLSIKKPTLALRVSANTAYTPSAKQAETQAKQEDRKKYTIQVGSGDIHFVERVPFNEYY